jgi:hypothetical protein
VVCVCKPEGGKFLEIDNNVVYTLTMPGVALKNIEPRGSASKHVSTYSRLGNSLLRQCVGTSGGYIAPNTKLCGRGVPSQPRFTIFLASQFLSAEPHRIRKTVRLRRPGQESMDECYLKGFPQPTNAWE